MENLKQEKEILFSGEKVAAGFPSPAEGYAEGTLDLNEHLIKNPPSTFFVRASGESMIDAGIFSEDILIVDRSLSATNGSIIIALINGEFTVKRFLQKKGKTILTPENSSFESIQLTEEDEFSVWGVVTNSIRSHTIKQNNRTFKYQ